MNAKTLIAGLIGGIVFFLLGFVLYGFVFGKMMEAHSNMSCMRSMEDMNMVLMVVSNLLWGITFAYIFGKANFNSTRTGATQGAIIAVLIGLTIDIFMYTTTTLYPDWTVAGMDIVINIITGAIGGAA